MTVGPPESGSLGMMSYARAMIVTPMKMTPNRIAIASIVLPAFFDSGGLKAGTPFAIASTPVKATEPLAKARRISTMPSVCVPSLTASVWWGSGVTEPVAMWNRPEATMTSAMVTNRYVGTAKMFPDSRRPRRFATVMSAMTATATSSRTISMPGRIEISWSIADEVDTATVIT